MRHSVGGYAYREVGSREIPTLMIDAPNVICGDIVDILETIDIGGLNA